jgi:hypothetical protein
LKKYNSAGSDQIPTELIKAGGETLRSDIHKLINSIWNKEELPDQWRQSVIITVYKKGDKTDCGNYRTISLLSTSYKILSNLVLSELSPHVRVHEIIVDCQCGFRRNKSTTDHIFLLHSSDTGEKWECHEIVNQLFIDFERSMIQLRGKYCTLLS